MDRYRDQVAAALSAVTIRDPPRYTWLGCGRRPLGASTTRELDARERRDFLVTCLCAELYASFYCHGAPVPARWGQVEPASPDPWLAAAMSRANTGCGSWEPGWTVERLDGKEALLTSSRMRARFPLADCRVTAGSVRPGASVRVRVPKELPARSPGFFTVMSNAPADLVSAGSVVRVYWNITRAGAPALIGEITSRLNAEAAPFRLKVADHAFRFDRCDAAVLYLPGERFPALRGAVHEIAVALGAQLKPQIPAFTLELAPGIGLAEAGGDGESFGARRCALLAEAIVRAHADGLTRAEARFDAVAACFAEGGVQIDAPYLDPALAGRHVL